MPLLVIADESSDGCTSVTRRVRGDQYHGGHCCKFCCVRFTWDCQNIVADVVIAHIIIAYIIIAYVIIAYIIIANNMILHYISKTRNMSQTCSTCPYRVTLLTFNTFPMKSTPDMLSVCNTDAIPNPPPRDWEKSPRVATALLCTVVLPIVMFDDLWMFMPPPLQ